MKKNTWLFAFLLLAAAGRAWGQSMLSGQQSPIEQPDYYVKIPFEVSRGIPVIPVEIGGKTYRFLLDTGAPTLLSEKLSQQLALKPLAKLAIQDANAQVDSLRTVLLPSLKISGITFVNQPVLVAAQPLIFDCLGVDGFLGSNFLRNSIVQFSYPDRLVTIASDARQLALDANAAADLLVEPSQSSPLITMRFTGEEVGRNTVFEQLLFDTGYSGFYDLTMNKHFNLFRQAKALRVLGQAQGGDNVAINGVEKPAAHYRVFVPELTINGAKFRNVTATTTNDYNSRLGNELLKHGRVTVDYKNKKFYFEPFSAAGTDLQAENHKPLAATIADGKLCVGMVWDKKLARKIAPGDQILSVDGVSCEQFTACDIMNNKHPTTRPGSRLKIKTKRGQIEEVVLAAE